MAIRRSGHSTRWRSCGGTAACRWCGAAASRSAAASTAAGCSFLGTSIFALTGILLRDPLLSVPDLLSVIGAALVFDVLVTPFVLPLVLRVFDRIEPDRVSP